ncbi:hypothetical protein, variant 1 [Aphanomyces invadans]|uniref:Tubulin-tyrosine ligase family n=1 Tax=Aphanomyces invadans TaxID=157072 RepID=A0A024UB88_9STRA|nr:hypothetical protein, variant 1 [Aphanomyces invadans]ETW02883.1 hypothetical protein, variant 1 [Aphanomyces invadans]|eukprot:XP_008868267.1 hypothetical protein, variant 1 [Aphanomyces invadans]
MATSEVPTDVLGTNPEWQAAVTSPTKKAFVSKIPRRSVKLPTPINALPVQLAATESSQPDEAPSSNNQQESATPPKAAVVDKHQQYIKDLEEKKRKAREEEVAKAEKQRRLRLKLRKSILQRAASIRTETDAGGHDTVDSTRSPQDESEAPSPAADDVLTDEERKAKAAAQKRLLQKQQATLEALKVKRQKEAEAAEAERQRAQKKKELTRKASLGTTEVPSRMQDALDKFNQAAAGSAVSAVRVKKEEKDESSLTPEQKEQRALQQEAIKKKQVEYLQKLADERKQKQLEEDEKNELLRQKRAKVREEALLKHEAAKAEKAAAAAAAEESATPVVVEADEVRPKVNVEAMVSRLSKLKTSEAQLVPEAKDFASWKKRNGVAPDTKVFCMTGWYPVIKDTLEKRGWFHNPDRNSPYFDLKWALKSDDLKNVKLHDDQLVNHFLQNTAITTKSGLLHNLRNVTWFLSEDIDSFFPRAYDLNEPADMQSYIQDFRYIRAEGMLKRLGVQCRAMLNAIKPSVVSVNLGVLDVVLSVCRKRQEILPDDVLDNPNACGIDPVVTDLQWDVLQRCPVDAPGSIRPACVFTKPSVAASSEFGDQPPPHLSPSEAKEEAKAAKRHEKLMEAAFIKEKARLNTLLSQVVPLTNETATKVLELLQGLEDMCPQFHLNGADSKNVWIVKPAGMSRGRGIRVFNQLNELLEYADVENHKECQWIVQKYIENPLLVCNRKFDIRQWVFVTSWNPLTVWFYLDCYLRFSSEEYQVDDLTDQYVHLTNNSIQKNGENFYKAYTTEDGSITIEGNMLHSDDLSAYLTRKYGLDPDTNETIFTSKIQPRMKEIVKWSLSCVQDTVQHRKNSCELYGYDFMLDETFKPWLIEVNSSPACDYSTAVTKRYIETGLEDILKVMLDVREYDAAKRKNSMVRTC